MKDALADVYSTMISESAKQNMTVNGDKVGVKTGSLPGPTNVIGPKNSGPDAAEFKKAEEAPKELSPISKKKIKENINMNTKKSFQELFDAVISEEDIESSKYSDEIGDFPPTEGEASPIDSEEDMGEEMAVRSPAEIVQELRGLIDELASAVGADEDMGDEMPDELGGEEIPGEKPVGEAVSEPEPKEFKGNIKPLQAPRKLGGIGVKTKTGKASTSAGNKARTGSLETAPKGVKPGEKSFMKVGGSGPAATGKNASAFES